MKKLFSLAVLMMVLTLTSLAQTKNKHTATFSGFGPVKIGMTSTQASKAIGVTLRREGEPEGDCSYVAAKSGLTNVAFMMTGRRISRIDIMDKGWLTNRGAGVGDTEARIKRLYKGVKVSPHKYVEGHYLEVRMGKYGIVFETDGKKVMNFRVGKFPEVQWIEGCS